MITNIIDNRENSAKSDNLDFVVEPSCADNSVKGAHNYDPDENKKSLMYAERLDASIHEAITWASGFELAVTLYIYDKLHDHIPNYKTITVDDSSPKFNVDD